MEFEIYNIIYIYIIISNMNIYNIILLLYDIIMIDDYHMVFFSHKEKAIS